VKLSIVVPVVIQNNVLVEATLSCAEHLSTQHDATLYIVCNRLRGIGPVELENQIAGRFRGRINILYEPGVERSVSGAWNLGCAQAVDSAADYIAIVANDTELTPDCLDLLVGFGEASDVDLWSGISYNSRDRIDTTAVTDGADFTCFMIRPSTLDRFGMFDPNYRPAYFEDNDYYARVILGGGDCRVVHAAQFFHHGSMTVRADADVARDVRRRFKDNRSYFSKKWGVPFPLDTREEVLSHYYRHPFNDESKPLSWFEGEPW
jgi:GT2 family glycosyltransferase